MQLPKFAPQTGKILKIASLALGGVVLFTLLILFLSAAFRSLGLGSLPSRLSLPGTAQGTVATSKSTINAYDAGAAMPELSLRNIAPMPPASVKPPMGNDAEAFEVTNYYANIEARDLTGTCGKIFALKAKTYIIFENSNAGERYCSHTFKTEREHTDEVLSLLKDLDPKELTENTQTIKQTLDDFTSQIEILQKKKETVEKTLDEATQSYDEIAKLATKTQDAESLAKIIDSKLRMLERLTQERLNISQQLEQYGRAKAEQVDRLKYTFFSVNVSENKYLDGQSLKESWQATLKGFVNDINEIAQNLSINLVAIIFFAVQVLVYFFILLVTVKYVWRWTKRIWRS